MDGVDTSNRPDIMLAKLTIPEPSPFFVARPALYAAFLECLAWKVVLVAAPIGSGKTSLLSEWHRRLDERKDEYRTTWITVDGEDCDKARFWRHFLAALARIIPELNEDHFFALYGQDPKAFYHELSNFLYRSIEGDRTVPVIFIDNLDAAPSLFIAEILGFIGEYLPKRFHVIAAGAHFPAKCIQVNRRNDVCFFPYEKLAFSQEETTVITRYVVKTSDVEKIAATLQAITEGWITGVRSCIEAISHGVISSDQDIDAELLNTLVDGFFSFHVFNEASEEIASFLIETSLVDKLLSSLCDYLTGRNDSQTILNTLIEKGFFIERCPDDPMWFRYHPQFLRWLRGKMFQLRLSQIRELGHGMTP